MKTISVVGVILLAVITFVMVVNVIDAQQEKEQQREASIQEGQKEGQRMLKDLEYQACRSKVLLKHVHDDDNDYGRPSAKDSNAFDRDLMACVAAAHPEAFQKAKVGP